jgi:DtxR family Mn-dependent transcriptional regulator
MAYHNLDKETSESIEMYLLRIALLRSGCEPVPLPALAQELSVSTVSANEMCRRLVEKGWLAYEPYKGVTLTAKAESLVRRVLRNRRLWEVFLVEKLGLTAQQADEIACRFEHVTPDELAARLAAFLGHPRLSPGNQPIPYDDQTSTPQPPRPLAALAVGERGQVAAVKGDETSQTFLRHQGLRPGATVEVLAVAPEAGFLLDLAGQRLTLAQAMATQIEIIVDQPEENCMEQFSAALAPTVSLNQLNPGQAGTIVRVSGRTAARRRLLEMGLVRGERIVVERVAPLGDPVEFVVKGYHLSLRRQDAANIEVELKN